MSAVAAILGAGITTSVGGNTAQSCAALRAGLARFSRTDLHLTMPFDEFGDDLDMPPASLVPGLPFNAKGADRLLGMLAPALVEAVADSRLKRDDFNRWSLHLALPDSVRPEMPGLDSLPEKLVRGAALPAPANTTVARAGQSGFADALIAAGNAFRTGVTTAVVAGADTWLHGPSLAWLDAADRLKCPRVPDGLIPGEAAGVLILRKPTDAKAAPQVAGLAAATEPAPVFGDAPGVGVGFTEAVRAASAMVPNTPAAWALLDQNGERYRAAEWGYLLTRLHALFGSPRADWLHADCIGDIGAATGGVAAARALHAWRRGYAPRDTAWILLGSDSGGRGVVALRQGGPA